MDSLQSQHLLQDGKGRKEYDTFDVYEFPVFFTYFDTSNF